MRAGGGRFLAHAVGGAADSSESGRYDSRMINRIAASLAFSISISISAATLLINSATAAPPELILHGGKIVTVDQAFSVAEAIAIESREDVDGSPPCRVDADVRTRCRSNHRAAGEQRERNRNSPSPCVESSDADQHCRSQECQRGDKHPQHQ